MGNILEVEGSMALGFVDLEKAFDTIPREMLMATLRWMGVPEAEVRVVEGMYEKTTARVVVGELASGEFEVKIGLRQGSVLSPLLFISLLDLISRKTVMKDAMKKPLYADDLALVANGKQELQETLEVSGKLAVYLTRAEDKPREDGSAAHRPPEGRAGHRAGGEETDSGEQFRVHRRGSVRRQEDGEREREVCRRAQGGANAWRAVEGWWRI